MPSSITFQTAGGTPALEMVLKLAANLKPTANDLRYVAERHKARIIKRTGQGVDVNNQAFKPYTEKYAERKRKSGRDSGRVDLTWSGRMLKSLVVHEVSNSGYLLGIYGEEGVRAAAHNRGNAKMPTRTFVAPSKEDQAAGVDDLKKRIMARVNGTNLN